MVIVYVLEILEASGPVAQKLKLAAYPRCLHKMCRPYTLYSHFHMHS